MRIKRQGSIFSVLEVCCLSKRNPEVEVDAAKSAGKSWDVAGRVDTSEGVCTSRAGSIAHTPLMVADRVVSSNSKPFGLASARSATGSFLARVVNPSR